MMNVKLSHTVWIMVLLLTTATCQAELVPAPRTQQSGWLARHEAINARVKQGGIDLLFIGDSVVENLESAGKEVWSKFYTRLKPANLGIAGDRAENILWRLDNGEIAGIAPKLVVIMTGHDGDSTSPEDLSAGTRAIVEKLRARLPKTKVLIVGTLPNKTSAAANSLVAKLADEKTIFYTDIGARFLDSKGEPLKELMPEAGRLTAKGYQVCAEWLDNRITTIMGAVEDPLLPSPLDMPEWKGAWLKRHESFNARAREGNVDLVFIGDSITNGWANEGKHVWEKYYGQRNAVNLGISCDRIQNVLWRLDNGNIEGIAPKVAVLMIGTNNSSRSRPEEIPSGIKAVLDRLRTKLPNTKILLLAIFPRGKDSQDRWHQVNVRVNEQIAAFADGKSIVYLDIGAKFLGADGKPTAEIQRDFLHFSAKGYAIWAEAMEPTLAAMMGEK